MAFRTIIWILISLSLSANSLAQNIKIKANHPDQYTVVKGDTLWDISGKFLENPWQWPNLWDNNPHIKNPHLIYPGNTLYFSIVDGKPRISFSRNLDNSTLKPRMRESSIVKPVKLIPTDAISQFLTSPKVVDKYTLDESPYVIDFAGEHLIVGAGDRVYVRSITEPTSLKYTIYRSGETYISPVTKEILGYEAKFIADTTLEKAGDPATLSILKSSREIRRGDRIMVSAANEVPLNFFPRPPKKPIHGNIISVLDGVSQIGQYNVVVLDKGAVDGIKNGHTLHIFQKGRIVRDPFSKIKNASVKLPDEMAGTLMVFRAFERVSYALVLEATQPIHVLDKIQTPL
ncbi:MAG: LysM peptidoglycan-binding domain-containing protein [Methylococcaceae bacterium]|nr:LysM peptidoglycan-binding domain-containing protein [Methylococcaceae bacterium]